MDNNNGTTQGIWSVPRFFMGSNIDWEQFLRANSFTRDENGRIYCKKREQIDLPEDTHEIVASRDVLLAKFGTNSEPDGGAVERNLDMIKNGDSKNGLVTALDALRSSFDYNMALVLEQLQLQNQTIYDLLKKLDAIHNTLQSPTLTRAKEYYRIGCERMVKGLLDKALESFLESASIDDANFMTHMMIGKLHLYGVNDECTVVDLEKAKHHFRAAYRYAKAESTVLPDANHLAGEALLHTAIAMYAQANDAWIDGNSSTAQEFIQESLSLAKQAAEIDPDLSESHYHCAKLSALIGDGVTAANSLEKAIAIDEEYSLKAEIDKDFRFVRKEVSELHQRLRKDSAEAVRIRLAKAEKLLKDWVYLGKEAQYAETEIRQLLKSAHTCIGRNTYLDNRLAIQQLERATEIFNSLLNYKCELNTISGHTSGITCLAFGPNGKVLASGGTDNTIRLWNAANQELTQVLHGHADRITSLTFSHSGETLASVDKRGGVKLWSIAEGRLVRDLMEPAGQVNCLVFSPDDKMLAVGSEDQRVSLWNVQKGALLQTLSGMSSSVNFVAFNRDSDYLTVGTADQKATLWNLTENRSVRTYEGNAALAKCLAADLDSEDPAHVTISDPDKRNGVAHKSGAAKLAVQAGTISWLSLCDAKKILAMLSHEKALQVWDTIEGKLLHTLHPFAPGVTWVYLNGDATVLATNDCQDKSVKLWAVQDGSLMHVIAGNLSCEAFSPDGTVLVTGDHAGQLKFWGRMVTTRKAMEESAETVAEPKQAPVESPVATPQHEFRKTPSNKFVVTKPAPVHDFKLQSAQRRKAGLCMMCGKKLSVVDKLVGYKLCKEHRY